MLLYAFKKENLPDQPLLYRLIRVVEYDQYDTESYLTALDRIRAVADPTPLRSLMIIKGEQLEL